MSVEAMTWALNLAPVPIDPGGGRKAPQPNSACAFVLVGLANHAGPDGKDAFPGVPTLMRYTRLSERTVRTALDRLEGDQVITPGDPDVVAAKIKRADRRTQGYGLNMNLIREDLTGDELRAIGTQNPWLRHLIDLHISQRGATDAPRDGGADPDVNDDRGATDAPRDRGATTAPRDDERGATDAERGATVSERGATVAPEPSLNPTEPYEGQKPAADAAVDGHAKVIDFPGTTTPPADTADGETTTREDDESGSAKPRWDDRVEAVLPTAREIVTRYMDWWKVDRGLKGRPIPNGPRDYNALVGAKVKAANCSYVTAALLQGYTELEIRTALHRWAAPADGRRRPDGTRPSPAAWTAALVAAAGGRQPENPRAHRRSESYSNDQWHDDPTGGYGPRAAGGKP
jgi:hypothetical protein